MPRDFETESDANLRFVKQFHDAVRIGDFLKATTNSRDVFEFVTKNEALRPSHDLSLLNSASEFVNNSDWIPAENQYLELLKVPDVERLVRYGIHKKLASLYILLDRELDTLAQGRFAVAEARAAEIPFLLVMALIFEGKCLIKSNLNGEAFDVVNEAASLIDSDPTFDQVRASVLTLRSECNLGANAFDKVHHDLDPAFVTLTELSKLENAAGVQCDLAYWWSVTAKLRFKLNDKKEGIIALREELAINRKVRLMYGCEDVNTRFEIATTLKKLTVAMSDEGSRDASEEAFGEYFEIMVGLGLA